MNTPVEILNVTTGDALLVSSHGSLPKAIHWFQECKWNHAAFFIVLDEFIKDLEKKNGHDFTYVLEATRHGVILTPFRKYIEKDCDLLVLKPIIPFTRNEKLNAIEIGLPLTEKGYEFKNLLWHQLVKCLALKLFNQEIWIGKPPEESDDRFICGELVMYIYDQLRGWFPESYKGAPVNLFEFEKFKHFYVNKTKYPSQIQT